MLRFALALLTAMPLLASSAGADPVDISWKLARGGYHTKQNVASGSELRLRVKRVGRGELVLSEWRGKKQERLELQRWRDRELSEGQVLTYRVPRRMKLALQIDADKGGKPKERLPQDGFDRLKFGGGWSVDVKMVGVEF